MLFLRCRRTWLERIMESIAQPFEIPNENSVLRTCSPRNLRESIPYITMVVELLRTLCVKEESLQ
jgi:hypothetical protein